MRSPTTATAPPVLGGGRSDTGDRAAVTGSNPEAKLLLLAHCFDECG